MYNSNQNEQEILKYWQDHKCFEKSVSERPENKPYVFYDGPPFATGLPHYGHIVASLMKDAVPRYWTMRGFRVERRWGWDCHGLPIENIIEKDLGLNSKKAIEEYGVGNFNEACRATVLKYANEWKKTVARMGRWVDMEHDYKTMDLEYMESVWWVFKQLWEKKMIYKGYKSMHICPRCATPLSNFEVTQGYKDVKDVSATSKFKLKNPGKYNLPENIYVLAWTTTPWTLPGNVLLAVGADIVYWVVQVEGEEGNYIIAKERVEQVLKDKKYKKIESVTGADLVGLEYEPLFPYFANTENAFKVVAGDFVSTQDGTGVVHIAPAFGEDDYNAGKAANVPLVQHVTMDGRFIPAVTDFAGMEVKNIDNPSAADVEVIKWLKAAGKLFSKESYTHSYPHCWRCDTPLLNYATTSWFVKVPEIKDQLLQNNEEINWVPEHVKEGRFGEWLKGVRDWAVSRNRYWGTPLPVWESDDGEVICVESAAELEKLSGQKVNDLHKHIIDKIEIKKDGKVYKRIPEVLDCWFESGSMPYGQMHYPFENKKKFEDGFPAEFIAEGQDQTRGWFYTLHVLATALTMGKTPSIPKKKSVPAFRNVIVNGIVLAEDGKKMSKRLKNYPEPDLILEKYGADAMRYYLLTAPVMVAESLNFSEVGVREVYSRLINTLWNVFEFYKMFAEPVVILSEAKDPLKFNTRDSSVATLPQNDSKNVLDKWILAKLNNLVTEVTTGMEAYQLPSATRPIMEFVIELSQWYVRRSRDRFKGEDAADKAAAVATLREVLLTLSKVMAPFTPFIAEKIYLELTGGKELESVHLETWPQAAAADEKVLTNMANARAVVEMGLALRAEAGLKVRQVLSAAAAERVNLPAKYLDIIKDELNVKEITQELPASGQWVTKTDGVIKVSLNTEITSELKKEGLAREIVRAINQSRKEAGLTMEDRINLIYETQDQDLVAAFSEYEGVIKMAVLADRLEIGTANGALALNGLEVKIKIVKI